MIWYVVLAITAVAYFYFLSSIAAKWAVRCWRWFKSRP